MKNCITSFFIAQIATEKQSFAPLIKGERGIHRLLGVARTPVLYPKSPVPPLSRERMRHCLGISTQLHSFFIVLCLACATWLHPSHRATAQTFTIFTPDASAFPLTRAQFYALDSDGRPILNVTNSNFTILENGARREVVSIEQPPDPTLRSISAVLTLDVSGSMVNEDRMNLARDAALDWIKTISLETSECALTSFDGESYVNQDFTRLRSKLLAAAQKLEPLQGTSYDNGFQQQLTGSLNVARRGRFKRVVVFLTDGLGGGTESSIIAAARRDSITVYCITVGLKMPDILRHIADSTGGAAFDNITSREELLRIYRRILFENQNIQPSTITWRTEPACISSREAMFMFNSTQAPLRSSLKYETPPVSLVRLHAQPRSITFHEVAIGNSQGQRVVLRATFQPVTITAIETNNAKFTIGGIQLPLTVSSGTLTSFIIGFTPQDSTPQVGRIDIRTATCAPVSLFVRATYGSKQAALYQTMSITAPSEGDVLYSGADTNITWTGLMPSEAVTLEYSINAGSTWETITESAAGLRSAWRVPPVSAQNLVSSVGRPMLVQARQVWTMPEGSEEPNMTLDGHWGSIISAKFSPDGTKILTGSADRTMRLWDAYTGASLLTFEGHSGLVSGVDFNFDGSKVLSTSYDNTARIWDPETAQILATGYGQGLNQFFFSQAKMTGTERLQFASTDSRRFIDGSFSPDGKEVVTTTDIGMTVEWKSASMRPVGFVRDAGGMMYSAYFNKAGNKLLTAGGDYSARLWTTTGRSPERSFFGHKLQVYHAAFSPDEKRVVTASEDGTARVWDAKTEKTLFAMAHKGAVSSAKYSPDGKRIVTASMDGTVRVWDATNGKQQAVLRGEKDNLGFEYAEFSPDGSRVVGVGVNPLGFVWEVGGGFLQEATSKQFTVIAPQATARDASMGGVMQGLVKDTTVSVITNSDKSVVRVLEARIVGANADEFSLVSGMPPFDVPSGTSKSVELRFAPRVTGNAQAVRTATLELITWTDTLRAALRGESIKKSFQIAPNLVFGQVLLKRRMDTTFTLLRNTGTVPMNIARIQALNTSTEQYSYILPKRPPFTLQAGDSISIQATFTPNSIGVASGGMQIELGGNQSNGVQKPLRVSFVGEGVATALEATMTASLFSPLVSDSSLGNPLQSSTLRIEEYETTIIRPLLNYVFFEENSAELAARYQRLLPDSTNSFNEEYSDTTPESKLRGGLEGYYQILNVFGKRLRNRMNTTARIVGCNNDDGAERSNLTLSRKRAEAVRDYLVSVWGIEARRLSIQARNKPERASNTLDVDGAAENRRVEIYLEPQETMSPITSNEAAFAAEPSIIRLAPVVKSVEEITEWSVDMMLGSRIVSGFSGTGTIPPTLDYRPTSAELRRLATIQSALPSPQALTFRLRVSNGALQSAIAQTSAIPFSLKTLREKQSQDSTGTRVERFALTFFDFDKSNLNQQNTQILNVAKRRITPSTEVSVLGYTDRVGEAAYNKRLSTDRANAVAVLIPSPNKQISGFGESLLLYDNTFPEGRFYCRMVEILLKSHGSGVKP
jgi:WD40 repeat protein/outer membrane protein OmpA-like peptidoglycan-associated protein